MKPIAQPARSIRVRGARSHNLKNINVDIPHNALTVVTGLSGSGKSSLAFDTIYAEGQRRYVESLSAYARQFLELMGKPDVDSIEGLSPAISIEQKTTSRNPRSTVGTVTEISDYMRLLWARAGTPYSPATGKPIEAQSVSQMVDKLMSFPPKTRFMLLAPVVRDRKGSHEQILAKLQRAGFSRARIDGDIKEIAELKPLNKRKHHNIDIVIDRIVIKENIQTRLADSFQTAIDVGDGIVYAVEALRDKEKEPQTLVFSSRFCCPVSGFTLEDMEPRLFSFNSPRGACPACDGLGTEAFYEEGLIVPFPHLSIADGALLPLRNLRHTGALETLREIAQMFKKYLHQPWEDLPQDVKERIIHGDSTSKKGAFGGVEAYLKAGLAQAHYPWQKEEFTRYQTTRPCHVCGGSRLCKEALCVKIHGANFAQIASLSIERAREWFADVISHLPPQKASIAKRIVKEIVDRLTFLDDVGLDYLTLDRSAATLSGGESQRIRLASQIGSGLTGVLYVLDEPSIGLHQKDNGRLLTTLENLKALGNTVIVVEHDDEAIRYADWIVDMGPGAGIQGGHITGVGTPKEIAANKNSLTGDYLSGRRKIEVPSKRRHCPKNKMITIEGATGHNLKDVSCQIPTGVLTCVTGVSGSGKSTLVNETLYKTLSRRLMGSVSVPAPCRAIKDRQLLDKIINIDQSPIGRTPRSNPATYTGLFTYVRDWFAALPESKARGYKSGRFSFNVKGGRCEACQGDGVLKIEMHFLPDVYVKCDTCAGKRYNRETLEVRFRGKTIADVLDMSVDEAYELFSAQPRIRERLDILQKVGLGYMPLGQQATTLSGGEAQRIKLSKELARRATGRTLYILDEPTTGLHAEDIRKLLEVLQALVEQGNSIVVIEHNLDVIKTADWIIDIGPSGGERGGKIVAQGTPEDIAKHDKSYTGQYLAKYLG